MEKMKIIIVNNNMKIGGIQKALLNLLYEISPYYDITLFLFNNVGEYLEKVPKNIKIVGCNSPYKYFGMSQSESRKNIFDQYNVLSFHLVIPLILAKHLR